jgi:hypothetical protein
MTNGSSQEIRRGERDYKGSISEFKGTREIEHLHSQVEEATPHQKRSRGGLGGDRTSYYAKLVADEEYKRDMTRLRSQLVKG